MLFSYGFRTFFIAAALVSAAAIAMWGVALNTAVAGTAISPHWHAHEMVFAYGGALTAGFVLTSVPNWTKTARVHGWPLVVLLLCFVAGRLASFVAEPVALPLHALGVVFLFGVAWAIGRPIINKRNQRNYKVLAIVLALAVTAGVSVAARTGLLAVYPTVATSIGVDLLIVLIGVVGGRITPLFTRNATGYAIRSPGLIDKLAMASLVAVVLVRSAAVPATLLGAILAVAAAANLLRMRGWGSRAAASKPILLMLHLGYLWVVLGLGLGAVAAFAPALITTSTATHALTAGALGTFGLGMMARVALGHTGRPIVTRPASLLAFLLVLAAAVIRVFGPMLSPPHVLELHGLAAVLWATAFVVYLGVYAPILLRARSDGRPD